MNSYVRNYGICAGIFLLTMIPSSLCAQAGSAEAASVRSVEILDKRVSTLEARMGRNVTTPTATNNLERRLDDIEDRLDDLEKKINDLEKLERRVRDLERKK